MTGTEGLCKSMKSCGDVLVGPVSDLLMSSEEEGRQENKVSYQSCVGGLREGDTESYRMTGNEFLNELPYRQ